MVCHLAVLEVEGANLLVVGFVVVAEVHRVVAAELVITELVFRKVLDARKLAAIRQENCVNEKLKGKLLSRQVHFLAEVVVHGENGVVGVASCHVVCGFEFRLAAELFEARLQNEQPKLDQDDQDLLCRRCSAPPAVAQSYGSRQPLVAWVSAKPGLRYQTKRNAFPSGSSAAARASESHVSDDTSLYMKVHYYNDAYMTSNLLQTRFLWLSAQPALNVRLPHIQYGLRHNSCVRPSRGQKRLSIDMEHCGTDFKTSLLQ